MSLERIEKEKRAEMNLAEDIMTNTLAKPCGTVSKNPYDYSSDSSGQGTRFAMRTGDFYLDFPESPKVPKMKRNQTKKGLKNKPQASTASDKDNNNDNTCASDSDAVIEPSGVPKKQNEGNEESSDTVSLLGEDNIDNNIDNFKRGQYGLKRGILHYFMHIAVNKMHLRKKFML